MTLVSHTTLKMKVFLQQAEAEKMMIFIVLSRQVSLLLESLTHDLK